MYEETYPWPIKCHICLNEFTVEVGRMKAEKELRCPDCGGRLEYMVKQLKVSWPRRHDSALTHTGTCFA
jgi:DNA-directed RNA polymerase subunit RPC12/RpoP